MARRHSRPPRGIPIGISVAPQKERESRLHTAIGGGRISLPFQEPAGPRVGNPGETMDPKKSSRLGLLACPPKPVQLDSTSSQSIHKTAKVGRIGVRCDNRKVCVIESVEHLRLNLRALLTCLIFVPGELRVCITA